MAGMVTVKPVRIFDMFDGRGVHVAGGEPFEVSRGTAAELLANGLVELVVEEPAPAPKRKGKADADE